ncbi:MAG: imelysin family protein [Flavobacteriales bacterium]|nr:imelysin family protein [Flavobacteriales bacterium]
MKKLLFVLLAPLALIGCKKDKKEDFDRGAMLNNMASAVIIPSINSMNQALINLDGSADEFIANPNATNLTTLQSTFIGTYKNFERCKMYDFGPMMDNGVKAAMNTYPVDTAKIEDNVESGSYTLGSLSNTDAIGLPAMDYLLYFEGSGSILDRFTTDALAENRKTYLGDLTEKMKTEFAPVLTAWNATYKSEFIAADGTDVGSSTGIMFNEFVKDVELLKNAKVGIPAGQFSGGEPLPEMTEAHFSKQSKVLALENVTALLNCFKGGEGIGFDDYIIDVQGEDADPSLSNNIIAQFGTIQTKINALGNDFNADVLTNFSGFTEAFQEIKKLVTYTKTDMASTLGLQITFSDSDGD